MISILLFATDAIFALQELHGIFLPDRFLSDSEGVFPQSARDVSADEYDTPFSLVDQHDVQQKSRLRNLGRTLARRSGGRAVHQDDLRRRCSAEGVVGSATMSRVVTLILCSFYLYELTGFTCEDIVLFFPFGGCVPSQRVVVRLACHVERKDLRIPLRFHLPSPPALHFPLVAI